MDEGSKRSSVQPLPENFYIHLKLKFIEGENMPWFKCVRWEVLCSVLLEI